MIYVYQDIPYEGVRSSVKKICGVSILRAGETMEQALSDVCKDIRCYHSCLKPTRTAAVELFFDSCWSKSNSKVVVFSQSLLKISRQALDSGRNFKVNAS